MNRTMRFAACVTSILLLVAILLYPGNFALAADPGSAQDPLVTQSYIDNQVKTLQAQVYALEGRISILEARLSGLSSVVPTPPASTGTGVQTPTKPVVQPISGKKVYPKAGMNNINIRSGPGTDFVALGKLNALKPLPFLSERSGWYQIRMPDGRSGWVTKELTEVRTK